MVAQLEEVKDKTFDYVVIGGGTAGMTVAGRLVEDLEITVAVLEAGEANLDDPNIILGGKIGHTWGNPKYDWNYKTVPQKHSHNREHTWNRGKGIGGSSGMNFCFWNRPAAGDVDAWEELGNPGWNWEDYRKYSMRSEHYTPATLDQRKGFESHPRLLNNRGTEGPVKVTDAWGFPAVETVYFDALEARGIKTTEDPYSGDISGKWLGSTTLDPNAKLTRSYAATAYYRPHEGQSNFKVLPEAHTARILFSDEKNGERLVAVAVEFVYGSEKHVVYARKEVILSAGTIGSPQILELSGVGRRDVLERANIPVKMELPGVGENVQDHLVLTIAYELKKIDGYESFDTLRDPQHALEQKRLHDLGQKNLHQHGIRSVGYVPLVTAFPDFAKVYEGKVREWIEEQKATGTLPPGLAEQYDVQLKILANHNIPDMEFAVYTGWISGKSTPEAGKPYLSVSTVQQHPLSRGTIHIASNNPLQQPVIDPHVYEHALDAEIMVKHVEFSKLVAETEPLKSIIEREIDPGADVASEEDILDFVKGYSSTCFHAIGSLSMLPREKGGVVDPELKVYGTANLRVADISIVPLHIAAHTNATAYMIGEKLADILKKGHSHY